MSHKCLGRKRILPWRDGQRVPKRISCRSSCRFADSSHKTNSLRNFWWIDWNDCPTERGVSQVEAVVFPNLFISRFLMDVEKAVSKETHNCMRVSHATYRQFQTQKISSAVGTTVTRAEVGLGSWIRRWRFGRVRAGNAKRSSKVHLPEYHSPFRTFDLLPDPSRRCVENNRRFVPNALSCLLNLFEKKNRWKARFIAPSCPVECVRLSAGWCLNGSSPLALCQLYGQLALLVSRQTASVAW